MLIQTQHSDGQRSFAGAGQLPDLFMPVVFVDGCLPGRVELVTAHANDLFWCAFQVDKSVAVMVMMEGGHEAMFRFKRDDVITGNLLTD